MLSYHPQLSTDVDFSELEKEFFERHLNNGGDMDIIRVELFDFFDNKTEKEIEPYKKTYWRLYVMSIWRYLPVTAEEVVLKAIEQQLPDASRLGIDVLDRLIWYFNLRLVDPELMVKFFNQASEVLFKSEWTVGAWKGQLVTIGGLVQEIKLLKLQSNGSIALAEFYQKLEQLLFPNGLNESLYEKYIGVETETAVMQFVELIQFFLNTKPEEVPDIVEAFTHPYMYNTENSAPQTAPVNPTAVPVPQPVKPTPAKPVAPKPPVAAKPMPPKPAPRPMAPPPAPKPVKPSVAEIRERIDREFPKNDEGDYLNIVGVLDRLQSLAQKYNDKKIAEWFYFDEAAGKFIWKA